MDEKIRNPIWGRDETILALNLLFQCGGKVPDKKDDRVIALSKMLRQNPTHAQFSERENFRSPSAVVLKLGNLQQEADGKGMPNNSEVDKAIWKEFGTKPAVVNSLASRIALAMQTKLEKLEIDNNEDVEFDEGRTYTRVHIARERNPNLRRKVLQDRKNNGKLRCEICEAAYEHLAEDIQSAAFEAHHIIPLAISGARTVQVKDMALLCATCHRLIHRLIADCKKWVSISDARDLLRGK